MHAQKFIKILLNNYYFLMSYYQNSILKEDFIALPGGNSSMNSFPSYDYFVSER